MRNKMELSEVYDIIERLTAYERGYCDEYCRINPEAAKDRRRDSSLIIGAYTQVMCYLDKAARGEIVIIG